MQRLIENKKALGMAAAALAVVLLAVWCFGIRTPAYAVFINGKKQFIVKNASSVENVLTQMTKEESKGHKQVELSSKVDLKRTFVNRADIMPASQVASELKKNLQFKVLAAAIIINEKAVAYVNDKETAQKLLKQIKDENSKLEEGEKLLSCSFVEKVQVKETRIALSRVLSRQGAWNLITTGTAQPEKYTVKQGDNLWTIARANDMYVADITKANHLDENEILDLGQEIILIKSKPYINVAAKVQGNKKEAIPFETKVITDKNASSTVKIKSEGSNGEKQVAYVLEKMNGNVEKKKVLSENIIKKPTDRVVVKGTKVYMVASRGGAAVGSGRLDWPVNGQITQYFGRHTGIDIAGSSGAAIRAADSGLVTFAGWQGGYGKFVIINHGNGMVTRYAHCSSLNVSAGQSVSRGQTIGARGSTGNSTGPHLHFEVLVNGSFVNPLSYLR